MLVYEAPLLRNLTSRREPLTLISGGSDIQKSLDLPRPVFIDFVLLLGTDFSQRLKGLGPARAIKLIREHRSIEQLLQKEIKFRPEPRMSEEEYLRQVTVAREIFETLPPLPKKDTLAMKEVDEAEVKQIMEMFNLTGMLADQNWQLGLDTAIHDGFFVGDDPVLEGSYFDNPKMSYNY